MAATGIIDTDTHIVESADLWTSRLPSRWGDRRLHVRWDDTRKCDVWAIGDRVVISAWSWCSFGWGEPYPSAPPTLADCHPATYDPKARATLMDDTGIEVAVLYPNIGGADLHAFGWDDEIAAAHASAYNDFQLEWVDAAPGRFVPMVVIPYWDVPRAVREIERCAGRGYGGVVTTGAPHLHGQPYLGDRHWDSIWSATVAAGLSVSFHVGNGDQSQHLNRERRKVDGGGATYVRATTAAFLDNAHQVTDLLLCGVLARFPDLRVVSVESGVGWIPFVLESCDYHFKKQRVWTERPEFGNLLPSDLARRQLYANYWFEDLQDWHLDALSVDRILFETDFPHPTCLAGDEVGNAIGHGLRSMSDDTRDKILRRNAAELYNLTST